MNPVVAANATSAAACTGNAATVTTNANLTGDVTSSGSNATTVVVSEVRPDDVVAVAALPVVVVAVAAFPVHAAALVALAATTGFINSHRVFARLYSSNAGCRALISPATNAAPPFFVIVCAVKLFGANVGVVVALSDAATTIHTC